MSLAPNRRKRKREVKPNFNEYIHPRNKLREAPDFHSLAISYPEFSNCIKNNGRSLDDENPDSQYILTKCLFHKLYDIRWDIPRRFLCPALTSRLNYVHEVADVLIEDLKSDVLRNEDVVVDSRIRVMDIGCGANCAYGLLSVVEYGWNVLATDISDEAIEVAKKIVTENGLSEKFEFRKQNDSFRIFENVCTLSDDIVVCLCNPPFYQSEQSTNPSPKRIRLATSNELVTRGGEKQFIMQIMAESFGLQQYSPMEMSALASAYRNRTYTKEQYAVFYSSLVSAKSTLKFLESFFRSVVKVPYLKTVTLYQGQLTRWVIFWSFFENPVERKAEIRKRMKL